MRAPAGTEDKNLHVNGLESLGLSSREACTICKEQAKDSQSMTAVAPELRPNTAEFTVSELSAALRRTVEDAYGHVRVRGEISGFRGAHSSGHCYFSLKDEGARLEAVIWRTTAARMKVQPAEG